MKQKLFNLVFALMFMNIVLYMMVGFLPAEATIGYDRVMTIWGITAIASIVGIIVYAIYDAMGGYNK